MTPTDAREFMAGTFGPARARTVITKLADQVEALTKERDALMEAAKLALDALVAESRTTESNVTLLRILTAITSLRQAGVQ